MIERRKRQRHARPERVEPGKINEVVALVLDVMERVGGIDRCLVMVSAGRSDQAELVCGIFVEDKRSKGAQASGLVADRLWNRSFQTKVGAVSGKTAVVGEAL